MKLGGIPIVELDYLKDGQETVELTSYAMWLEYLVMSPSYELARRDRAGELTAEDKSNLPADFKDVLDVFDDLGDVRGQKFLTWWRKLDIDLFAVKWGKPEVSHLATFDKSSGEHPDPSALVSDYIEEKWVGGGKQSTLLVAIPIGLSKATIDREIASIIEDIPNNAKPIDLPEPKYPLSGKRIPISALVKYKSVLQFRVAFLDWKLWRLGVFTKISDTYNSDDTGLSVTSKIDYNASDEDREMSARDRRLLTILTSRALKRGYLISENAARGVFPSYEPSKDIVSPNFETMRDQQGYPKFEKLVAVMKKLDKR